MELIIASYIAAALLLVGHLGVLVRNRSDDVERHSAATERPSRPAAPRPRSRCIVSLCGGRMLAP